MLDLKGKKVCITGGSKGIGFEIVKVLLEKGCIVHSISRSKPEIIHENLVCHQQDLYYLLPDLNGPFDVVIMNIGVNPGSKPFDEITEEEIDRTVFLNLDIHLKLAKRLKYKKIVFIDSILSFSGTPNNSLYCASKAFISVFNQSLRREGKDTYIVYPYKVNTKLFDEIRDFFTVDKTRLAKIIVSDIENNVKMRTVPCFFALVLLLEAVFPICVTDFMSKTVIKWFTKPKKE